MNKSTLTAIAMISAAFLGSAAFADGFVCENQDAKLRVKVYHQTQPAMGTRNAAVMVVSDPTVGQGHKTFARFSSDNSLLTSKSATYTGNVDLRFNDTGLKGKNIGGTKLGELDKIILTVAYSFDAPVANGTPLEGDVVLVRRAGSNGDINIPVSCIRYLKGE